MSENALVVGASWCGYTQKQYEILSSMNSNINVCNVDKAQRIGDSFHVPLCTESQKQNVTVYPTWKKNNTIIPGLRSANEII